MSDKRIIYIYIGETCGQTLQQRWKQFATSAFPNKPAHSGGSIYFRSFTRRCRAQLFVAFATPAADEPLLTYRIRFLEGKWLLQYVHVHGAPPCCNRK
jgi:hypothetical protein